MSLINDALKRARQQQRNAPPSGPALTPVRANQPDHRWHLLLGLLIVLLLLGAGGLILFAMRQHPAPPVARLPLPASAMMPVATPPAPLPVAPPISTAVPAVAMATSAPAPVAAPVKSSGPKLQGIFYDGARSTAIISGKTVRVGDVIVGYKVNYISPVEVNLTGPDKSETNLTLSQ